MYYCTNCHKKSSDERDLIRVPGTPACNSCGKSGYRCPRCGFPMRFLKDAAAPPQIVPVPPAPKEQKPVVGRSKRVRVV